MKKYKIIYIVIFILLLAILLTNGIRAGVVISSTKDYRLENMNAKGHYENCTFLIYNCIIIVSTFITSFIITLKKSNEFKYKTHIFIIIIILVLAEPIFMQEFYGGFYQENEQRYDSIFDKGRDIYNEFVEKEKNKKNYDETELEEFSNKIQFTQVSYDNIDNIIYYDHDCNLSEEDYSVLKNCLSNIKETMPNRKIVYLKTLKSLEKIKVYRFAQMENMMPIDEVQLNITCSKNGKIYKTVGITNNNRVDTVPWIDIENAKFKLTLEETKDVLIKYLCDNENYYDIVKNDENNVICKGRLYYYDSKVCEKIEFDDEDSYIIIDANTGEVLKKHFHHENNNEHEHEHEHSNS